MRMSQQKKRGEANVTTTVAFDRATYKKLRLLAVEEDSNVRAIIRRAVEEYLQRRMKTEAQR